MKNRNKHKIHATRIAVIMVLLAVIMTLFGCGAAELSDGNVTIRKYRGLQVEIPEPEEVTDEMVDDVIDEALEATAEQIVKTGQAAEGDMVTVDYAGSCNGIPFLGGTAEDVQIELGSEAYITANGGYEGFEDQIIGHSAGDEFTLTVKFPDDYPARNVAGKVADYDVTLQAVCRQKKASLTDKWVKEHSEESETVKEYKEEIRNALLESRREAVKAKSSETVMEKFLEYVDVGKYPEGELQEIEDSCMEVCLEAADQEGLSLKDYLDENGLTEVQVRGDARDILKGILACKLLVEEKELLTDSDYDGRAEKLAAAYGYEDDVDAFVETYGEWNVERAIYQEVAGKYLVEHASVRYEKE